MDKTKIIIGIFIIILMTFITGCVESSNDEQKLIVAGSTSVAYVVEDLADKFEIKYPDVVVMVKSIGSSAGVNSVYGGTANIGMTSRNLRSSELKLGLETHVICYDAIVVIVHPSNPVIDISMEDLKKIFTGEIKNWNAIGGTMQPITVVIREDGSGTKNVFEDLVHEDITPIPTRIMPGTDRVKAKIAVDPHAIGYVTMAALSDRVSPLKINGIKPTPDSIFDESYEISRPFLLLTKGTIEPLERNFIDFILGVEGQKIIENKGLSKVN